jgi:hypothetical protein
VDPIKSASGHIMLNLHFCIRCDPGCEMSMHYFSCSGGPGADPIKSATGHVTGKLRFCIQCDLHVT